MAKSFTKEQVCSYLAHRVSTKHKQIVCWVTHHLGLSQTSSLSCALHQPPHLILPDSSPTAASSVDNKMKPLTSRYDHFTNRIYIMLYYLRSGKRNNNKIKIKIFSLAVLLINVVKVKWFKFQQQGTNKRAMKLKFLSKVQIMRDECHSLPGTWRKIKTSLEETKRWSGRDESW